MAISCTPSCIPYPHVCFPPLIYSHLTSPTPSPSHPHPLTHTPSPSPSHPHTLTHTPSPSPSHPHTFTLTHTPSPSHPHTLTISLTHPHPHTHTLTRAPGWSACTLRPVSHIHSESCLSHSSAQSPPWTPHPRTKPPSFPPTAAEQIHIDLLSRQSRKKWLA